MTINLGPRLPGVSSGQPEGLGRAPLAPSYLALLRAGFGRPPGRPEAGGLLPHHFTLARLGGRYVSVPLSVGLPRLGVTQRAAREELGPSSRHRRAVTRPAEAQQV